MQCTTCRFILAYGLYAILFFSSFGLCLDTASNRFDLCQARVEGILKGSITNDTFNNESIQQFLYTGPVAGMSLEYAKLYRHTNFTTITTGGCKVLCDDPIDWYWASDISMTLGVVSTWIIPIIALLAALPWDSLHRRNSAKDPWYRNKFVKTVGALINWLGSPQTALTATLFNIHQLHQGFNATTPVGSGVSSDKNLQPIKTDAYYVLCCIGQFELKLAPNDRRFMEILAYGLFMPICDVTVGEAAATRAGQQDPNTLAATEWTADLLREMAFQLRMLRRRGVYPTFLSVVLFFVAYAVSLVLAFGAVGERTTAHSLAFGVLISWLPLLVLFAVLDRNPVSADRSRKLVSRWLWNVQAVKNWQFQQTGRNPTPNAAPAWWTLNNVRDTQRFDDYITEFRGQGRKIGYNGLASALLHSVYDSSNDSQLVQQVDVMASEARTHLDRRPGSWWILAFMSLTLVWLEILMAFVISYNTPTVGLGCRSGSYMIYGILSTIPWLFHLLPGYKNPGTKRLALCHVVNLLSTMSLAFICFAAFSGVLRNCFCGGGMAGYLDFESAKFYRTNFDVARYWTVGAVVAALPIIGSLIAAVLLLRKLKILWQASEQTDIELRFRRPGDAQMWLWLI